MVDFKSRDSVEVILGDSSSTSRLLTATCPELVSWPSRSLWQSEIKTVEWDMTGVSSVTLVAARHIAGPLPEVSSATDGSILLVGMRTEGSTVSKVSVWDFGQPLLLAEPSLITVQPLTAGLRLFFARTCLLKDFFLRRGFGPALSLASDRENI